MGLERDFSTSQDVLWMAILSYSFFLAICSAKEKSGLMCSSSSHANFCESAVLEHSSKRAVVTVPSQSSGGYAVYSKQIKQFCLQKRGSHAFSDVDFAQRPWLRTTYGLTAAGDDWHKEGFPKEVMFSYGDLLYEARNNPDNLLLGAENQGRWKDAWDACKAHEITLKTQLKIRDWFAKNISLKKASVYTALNQIEWNLKRFDSDPVMIWWSQDLMKAWYHSSADWQVMIEIGDALEFHIGSESHTISETKCRELKNDLYNLMNKFQGTDKSTNGRWGVSQSILALKNTLGTTSDMGTPLYELRINQILGPLGPESDLGRQAANLNPQDSQLSTRDLELHWSLNALDPIAAKKIGMALCLGAQSLSDKRKTFIEDEKKYIREFYTILNSQYYREGYTKKESIEDWYVRALGEDAYRRRVYEVRRLYRRTRWSDLWLRWTKLFRNFFKKG